MTRAEIIAKLEDLASNGGSIAELNACKALLALPEFLGDGAAKADPFGALDAADDLSRKRKGRKSRSQAA